MTDHKYGPKAPIVDAFIEHLKGMTTEDWVKVVFAHEARRREDMGHGPYPKDMVQPVWRPWSTVFYAVQEAASYLCQHAAWKSVEEVAKSGAKDIIADVTWGIGWSGIPHIAAGYAVWEIQASDQLREQATSLYYLPMFGFADEQAVLASLQPKEDAA